MAAIKIKPPKKCPRAVPEHLRKRVDERQFIAPMAFELDAWLKGGPCAPDFAEAPDGWHKFFGSFTVCGEGECIKTLYTIYVPGDPRPNGVDLDEWEKGGRKPATRE